MSDVWSTYRLLQNDDDMALLSRNMGLRVGGWEEEVTHLESKKA